MFITHAPNITLLPRILHPLHSTSLAFGKILVDNPAQITLVGLHRFLTRILGGIVMKNLFVVLVLCFVILPLIASHERAIVRQENRLSVIVGSGDQQAPIPVHLFYRTSLFETIYLSGEINAAGSITQIIFFNNFTETHSDVPTRIWLGETLGEDLSQGWIPSTHLVEVFDGTVNYPAGQNDITIALQTPYSYQGGNLVMMVYKPWEEDYSMTSNLFYAQTVGTSRSLFSYNHNTQIDPAAPPTTGVTGQFPKTGFVINTAGTGSLSGSTLQGTIPVEGSRIQIQGSPVYRITDANGAYNIPYLAAGDYIVTATKTGFNSSTQQLTITAGQAQTQDFYLSPLPEYFVQGRVVGSDAPAMGIANASVSLSGYASYETTTDTDGIFFFPGVYANNVYNYTISAPAYQTLNGSFTLGNSDLNLGDLVLNELAYAPSNVLATEIEEETAVQITWDAPTLASEGWLHYDSGENNTSFGTGGSLSFDVAARFPADSLAAYAGGYLQAIRYWPAQGGNFVVKVWRGGSAAGPGNLVVSQPVIPVLNAWNLLQLEFPVPITGTEEIWIGYLCDVTGVNLAYAGMDYGPAVNGYGNLIHWQGNWTTLLSVNSYCDFNWNLQGYAGMTAPTGEQVLVPIGAQNREMLGYKLWRLLQGQETNESAWTSLSPGINTDLDFIDHSWENVPAGSYLWAVRTVYTGGVMSEPAFSNPLQKELQYGTIAGIVRNSQNQPIAGATVSSRDITTTTNAAGYYVLTLNTGVHIVNASAPGYYPSTQTGVYVENNETTMLNFTLLTVQQTFFNDSFESYDNFSINFAPWTLTDVDMSDTYGSMYSSWQHMGDPMAFMVFNPSMAVPPMADFAPYDGAKFAASFAATNPPNNDWLISPLVEAGFFSFWARSYTSQYGLERIKVGFSNGTTHPNTFTILSGPDYIEVPTTWTLYQYMIPEQYYYQQIRIGIRCCSWDSYILGIDKFQSSGITAIDDPGLPAPATMLYGNYPNPFNPETTIRYGIGDPSTVRLDIFNARGQLVRSLVNAAQDTGNYSAVWDGRDDSGSLVSSGIYYYKLLAGSYSQTRKMLLLK